MRTYYIFSINKEISILSKENPYILFKSLESIYKLDKDNINTAQNIYEQVTRKLNKNMINNKIFFSNKDNQFYSLCNNKHSYYNKYTEDDCNLAVKNNYMILSSNKNKLFLLRDLLGLNLFVCDFQNKDYFWLDEIYC